MDNVYENCPEYENESYVLQLISSEDTHDLLKVYSDRNAVPLFNSDNCDGDDFCYTTESRMKQAVDFWLYAYHVSAFVRWTIRAKSTGEAIGTIELFHRDAPDYFTNCGLLRLDLRSDYEKSNEIMKILALIIEPSFTLFNVSMLAIKSIPQAMERVKALDQLGFTHTDEKLVGNGGKQYGSYYVLHHKN